MYNINIINYALYITAGESLIYVEDPILSFSIFYTNYNFMQMEDLNTSDTYIISLKHNHTRSNYIHM